MAEILHQLICILTIIYRVLYIPGGAGFQPSTVCGALLIFWVIFFVIVYYDQSRLSIMIILDVFFFLVQAIFQVPLSESI